MEVGARGWRDNGALKTRDLHLEITMWGRVFAEGILRLGDSHGAMVL